MSQLIRSSLPCKQCGSSRGYAIYEDNEHCFSCGYNKNKNSTFKDDYTPRAKFKDWQALSKDTAPLHYQIYIDKYDIAEDCFYNAEEDRLIFPLLGGLGWQARSLTNQPKWISNVDSTQLKLTVHLADKKKYVILVEDYISAIRLHKFGYNVACLFGCNPALSVINHIVSKFKVFIVWLDGDKAGKTGARKLLTKLSLCGKVEVVETTRDPKEYNRSDVGGILNETYIKTQTSTN